MSARRVDAGRDALRISVADVAAMAQTYARLGLRVIRQGRKQAVVLLPCGISLVLSCAAARRMMAAV